MTQSEAIMRDAEVARLHERIQALRTAIARADNQLFCAYSNAPDGMLPAQVSDARQTLQAAAQAELQVTGDGIAPRITHLKAFQPHEIKDKSIIRTGWDWCKENGFTYRGSQFNTISNVWEVRYTIDN